MSENTSSEERAAIARKAGRGVIWNLLSYGLGKGVVLLTTSILARLLTKEDFGLVAIAIIAINYLAVVKDLGLGLALVQRRKDIEEAANTVFTVNLLLGLALSLIVVPLAPLFAAYFEEPTVTPVLRWLGASFAINALGSVHTNLLMRDMDYRRKFIPDMGNTIVKGVTSIGLAFAGYGVWSLVFGQIAGALVSVLLVWIVLPWRPRLALNRQLAGELFKFGASITAVDILSVFADNLSYIIVGKIFGVVALGVFTMAYRLPEMLLIGNLWVMTSVIFPAFSSIQDKPDELRKGFLFSIRMVQLIAMPLCLGLFVAADPVVRVLFGDKWLDTIPLLRVLSLFALVYSIGYHVGDVYKAIGHPDILLKLNLLGVAIYIPALLIGSRYGLMGVAWAYFVSIVIEQSLRIFVATRFVDVTIVDILKEIKPAAQAALGMLLAASAALFLTRNASVLVQLILIVAAGAAAYLGVIWLTERKSLLRLAEVVLSPKH